MPETSLPVPLSTAELQVLAEFARFVDQCSSTRDQIRATPSLDQVIDVAKVLGFSGLSSALLLRANHHLNCTGWVWKRSRERWRDQLFVLSLINLISRQLEQALPAWSRGWDASLPAQQSGGL
jgi:hypothetical protein